MTTTEVPTCAKLASVFIGFDSAWADNPKAPGAICAVSFDGERFHDFYEPQLVNFSMAGDFVEQVRRPGRLNLIAIDQPTRVPNKTGMRPVEKAAASLVSWAGGGVQPANLGKVAFFGDGAPIWGFLERIGGVQYPEAARSATSGLHVIEVFPALSLLSLDDQFFGRLKGPRYNPGRRRTFQLSDWNAVIEAAKAEAKKFGLENLAEWLDASLPKASPRKAAQDMLDSVICLLVALRWRLRPRIDCVMLGDVNAGYMVAAASTGVRERLTRAAIEMAISLDGAIPSPKASNRLFGE
jgi:predicted RNase H-like nuclease